MYIFAFTLCNGVWNPFVDEFFWRHIIFEITKLNACGLSDILVLFTLQSVFSFLCDHFSSVTFHFVFPRIWSIVLNGWNSYLLCSDYCFIYFINVSAKVNMELMFWCSILMDCSLFLPFHLNSMNDCN